MGSFKVLIAAIVTVLMSSHMSLAQADFQKDGLLHGSGAISLGLMRDGVQNVYVSGYLEYFPEERVSLRGDGYYFVDGISEFKPLDMNHQVYAGALFHLPSEKIDPYIGFQPGIAISRRTDSIVDISGDLIPSTQSFNPLTSAVVGFNYWGGKHFSLFAEVRFTRGIHLANSWPKYLDELKFSFGLAFQIAANKKKFAR